MNRNLRALLLAAALVAGGAQSEIIRIDIGGSAAAPSGNWNTVSAMDSLQETVLDYATGQTIANASIYVAGSGSGWFDNYQGWNGGTTDWIDANAAADYFMLGNIENPVSVIVGGLSGSAYTIKVLSSINMSGTHGRVEVGGGDGSPGSTLPAFTTTTGTGASISSADWYSQIDGYNSENWMVWESVTPVDGNITINSYYGGGDGFALNALSIAAVPEPATAGLIGLSALVLFGIRRLYSRV